MLDPSSGPPLKFECLSSSAYPHILVKESERTRLLGLYPCPRKLKFHIALIHKNQQAVSHYAA